MREQGPDERVPEEGLLLGWLRLRGRGCCTGFANPPNNGVDSDGGSLLHQHFG
jgi:hypothetical protein